MRLPLRSAALLAALVALGSAPAASARAGADFVPAGNPVPGSFVVSLSEDVQLQAVQSTARSLVHRYGGTLRSVLTASMRGFVVRDLPDADARGLAADPSVREVFQDGTARVSDTQADPPHGLDRVDQRALPLDRAYTYNATAAQVTTYVLDTGIRTSHGDFEGRASHGFDPLDGDLEAEDCHGHGTHVAGTIGGRTWGVAKRTKLVAVRVLGCAGFAPDSAAVEGIEWVTRNAVRPAVANGSFSLDNAGIADEAIAGMAAAGVTFVVAAGNHGGDACRVGPARHPEVVAVGATDRDDARAPFSNHGRCVDLFAPGVDVTSAGVHGDSATTVLSGTSMAAPHVAGGAALYVAGHPTASPADVLGALTEAATPEVVGNPGAGSPDRLLHTAGFTEAACGGSTDEDVAIPDVGPAVTSAITVSGCDGWGGATTSVRVDIVHPYTADLAVDLIGPGGEVHVLREPGGAGSTEGIHQAFTVDTSGATRDGVWKLRVADVYAEDGGHIDGWAIRF